MTRSAALWSALARLGWDSIFYANGRAEAMTTHGAYSTPGVVNTGSRDRSDGGFY